ncbi:MAG: VCBS repeat-containing protein [Elusimicrobia bacterium]|nr:VCBS repeat-containing protein [Elusimicrobiota bacterium]
MDSAEVDVDVAASGLYEGGAWGDYDNDGDLDVLANGRSAQELRIYKNNGNGTMDAAQIEVDASGGGLRLGGVTWGISITTAIWDLDILTGEAEPQANSVSTKTMVMGRWMHRKLTWMAQGGGFIWAVWPGGITTRTERIYREHAGTAYLQKQRKRDDGRDPN